MARLVKKWRYPRTLVYLEKKEKGEKEMKKVTKNVAAPTQKRAKQNNKSNMVVNHINTPRSKKASQKVIKKTNKGAIIASLFSGLIAVAAIIFVFILFNKNNKLNTELDKYNYGGGVVYVLTPEELEELVAQRAAENPVYVEKEVQVEVPVEVVKEVEVI